MTPMQKCKNSIFSRIYLRLAPKGLLCYSMKKHVWGLKLVLASWSGVKFFFFIAHRSITEWLIGLLTQAAETHPRLGLDFFNVIMLFVIFGAQLTYYLTNVMMLHPPNMFVLYMGEWNSWIFISCLALIWYASLCIAHMQFINPVW